MERKNPWAPLEGGLGVFDEMLEKPCPYHRGSVKHTLKKCGMMKRYFSGGPQGKGDLDTRLEEEKGDDKKKDDDFPVVNNCFMIFGGPAAEPAMPAFLDWFGCAITFDHNDHPDRVPQPGRYPLVVNPIIGNTRLTKSTDGQGSGLNIMYAETLDVMGIRRSQLRPSGAPFHGIVPGKRALSLR
jgi:hypothetical protein